MLTYVLIGLNVLTLLTLITAFFRLSTLSHSSDQQQRENLLLRMSNMQEAIVEKFSQSRIENLQQMMEALKMLQDTLQKGVLDNRLQVTEALGDYAKELGARVNELTKTTETKLREINHQVEKRLSDRKSVV